MNHSINDDDYYVVHPVKKHIVKRLSSSSVRVPYGTKPKDHAAIRPHIEDANKKHGDGHTVMKGMDLKYESGYKPLQEEKEMKDYLTQAPFSFAKEIAEGFAPKQTEAQVVTESTHDDGTKKSTGNAFDFKAMIAKKREEEPKLRNHDRVKTSTGTVYKRKEDAEGADETDVKPQEKRGRGRPPGKYGSYKKRIKEALEQYAIDEERLDELSKGTLASYSNRALNDVRNSNQAKIRWKAASETGNLSDQEKAWKAEHERKAASREKGVRGAIKRLTKEDLEEMSQDEFDALIEDFEQLDELSKATLGSYIRRSALNARNKEFYAGAEAIRSGIGTGSLTTSKKLADSAKKRQRGIDAATFRLTKEDLDKMSAEEFDALIEDFDQLDELSKATLVKYASANRKDAEKRSPDHKQAAEKYLEDPDFYKKKGSPFSAKEVLTRYSKIKKKRDAGFDKAMARLTKEDVECLDESVHAITKKIASTYNIPHADAHAIFVGGSTKTMGKSMDHICNNHGFKDDATSYKENESFFNKAGVSKKEHEHLVKASM